ncbi:Cof-type HAD-IIB family hydrolase [Thermodesulfitimonas sp.]
MSGIKLVAVDLDDTLLDSRLTVSPRVKRTVAQATARGTAVVIATGRMFRAAVPYAGELGLKTPLITYQGALVKEPHTGREFFHRPVPLELARDVVAYLLPTGFHLQVYVDDTLYMAELTPDGERYARLSRVEPRVVGDLLAFLWEPPTKVLMVAPEPEIDRLLPELRARYGGALHIGKSKPYFLEFSHPEATKGKALARVAQELGVAREAVMAIGDSYNDLSMLEFAGVGVVVGNARPEIKACATYVTATNDADGVALAIERWVLGEEHAELKEGRG